MTSQAGTRSAPARPLTRLQRRQRRSRIALRTTLLALAVGVTALSTFIAGLLHAPVDFGLPAAPKPALLYAADGTTQLATIRPPVRRLPIRADQIPQVLRDAIIAAEDERFLDHSGVDLKATLRAAANDLAGGRRQGGSTLTQQYVKNVYVEDEQTLRRKVQEAGLAVRLEQRLSKQEIITNYLNVLFLGNGTYGVEAASQYYFGVSAKDLAVGKDGRRSATVELARASLLAGIAPAPSFWNPVKSMSTARARQLYTLNRMVVNKMITSAQASAARGVDVTPVKKVEKDPPSQAPEFTDALKTQLKAQYGGEERVTTTASESDFYGSGLRVKSTLDMKLQTALAQAMREILPSNSDPQVAAAAVDISSGDVKAMSTLLRRPKRVLSSGKAVEPAYGYEQAGTNLATSTYRSTGSTIKPFTLAAALAGGRKLTDYVRYPGCDTIPIKGPTKDYSYCNAAGESGGGGGATLAGALARSVNTVYVPLAISAGRAKVRDLALKSGFRVCNPASNPAACKDPFSTQPLSFGLGSTAEVTTLSLATAFATLMNGGVRNDPRYFTEIREGGSGFANSKRSTDVAVAASKPVRAMPKAIADQVVDAMSAVATGRGTAPAAAQPWTVYGKTGTTNDSNDARFVGCSKESDAGDICLSIWMGYEYISCTGVQGPCGGMKNLRGVKQVYGGTFPARIFARTFQLYRQAEVDAKTAAAAPLVTAPPAPTSTSTSTRTRSPRTEGPAPTATTTRRPTTTRVPTTRPPATTAPPRTTAPPATTVPPTPSAAPQPSVPPVFAPP